jgi:hypothetical protein
MPALSDAHPQRINQRARSAEKHLIFNLAKNILASERLDACQELPKDDRYWHSLTRHRRRRKKSEQ